MSEGMAVILIPCGGCEITYLTHAVAGEHVCPDCGYVSKLFEFGDSRVRDEEDYERVQ